MLKRFNEELMRKRLENFIPDPLVTIERDDALSPDTFIVPENDQKNVNLAKVNFLDFLNNSEIQQAAENAVRTYGMGTCGPQTFYGTTDLHEEVERHLAAFLHKDDSLLFSYGFMALSSTITAYCRPDDVIFVDEFCNAPIQHGINLSRSTVIKFAHNSPQNLRQQLKRISSKSQTSTAPRLFLVLEAISGQSGQICPLPDLLQIAEEHKMRVLLDETHSLGVLGAHGRGLLEHFGVEEWRVDVIFGTLEGALGSVGGFGAGSFATMGQLRLKGAGWLFSASIPTCLAAVALKGLQSFAGLPSRLKLLAVRFHCVLIERCKLTVHSHSEAPFKVFTAGTELGNFKLYEFCKKKRIFFVFNKNHLVINLNVKLLDEDDKLERVFNVLEEASRKFITHKNNI